MEKTAKFVLFFVIFIAPRFIEATKLNYPRVLLPIFREISVNFTLEATEKGCFKWWVLIFVLLFSRQNNCVKRKKQKNKYTNYIKIEKLRVPKLNRLFYKINHIFNVRHLSEAVLLATHVFTSL